MPLAQSSLQSLALLALACSPLAQAASGFTIRYYAQDNPSCNTNSGTRPSLACKNIGQAICCEEPPASSVFKYAQGLSAGPAGTLNLHELLAGGEWGGCKNTYAINDCVYNSPFRTATILGIGSVCQVIGSADPGAGKRDVEKMPEVNGTETATSKGCSKHNVVGIGGKDYRLEGQTVNEGFVKDLMEMASEKFVEKYGLKEWQDAVENVAEEFK
ncbi:hypothetical protein M409DRAFT_50422 [Zasmidium cellare ATCC 36951]|uniref:Uncharacterized protein n=1 Tax=Zasmidium cellare ATCC 36951 TaxID=1080233 RepID=A0A6A6CX33_ZASCE|nr:uncharacterized protein M409DRAFT_50422 [Zasmidium cellare ATCC 36951]KAF2171777.1 hypothetical protein M409DRAFT_50422 [Zasmidium cellare ATCC 36951]